MFFLPALYYVIMQSVYMMMEYLKYFVTGHCISENWTNTFAFIRATTGRYLLHRFCPAKFVLFETKMSFASKIAEAKVISAIKS